MLRVRQRLQRQKIMDYTQLNVPRLCSNTVSFSLQVRRRARWFAAADLPGRTGRGKVSLGRRVHHERPAAHREGIPMVAVQRVVLPSFLKVRTPTSWSASRAGDRLLKNWITYYHRQHNNISTSDAHILFTRVVRAGSLENETGALTIQSECTP